ncbi:MAG: tetratricopeptide repeat protein [Spirochaetaceae bacterium]
METELERADDLLESGMYNEAAELLNRILQEEPDELEALWRIGVAYTELNEPSKALIALRYYFTKCKEDMSPSPASSQNGEAYEAYGCATFKIGHYENAREVLEKAEEILPDSASVKRNLGVVYNQLGMKKKSYEKFLAGHILNPYDYRTEYALATAHIYFGEYEQAKTVLEKMLELQLPTEFKNLAEKSYRWLLEKTRRQNEE